MWNVVYKWGAVNIMRGGISGGSMNGGWTVSIDNTGGRADRPWREPRAEVFAGRRNVLWSIMTGGVIK